MEPNATDFASDDVERIFYDGDCGVCHWAVRFVAKRDPRGTKFRFAPLGGEVFSAQVSEAQRLRLPDSMVVQRSDGEILAQSVAVVHILKRLDGLWRFLGLVLSCVPRFLRDAAYGGFAAIRHRVVARPQGACPLPSPELRSRLDP